MEEQQFQPLWTKEQLKSFTQLYKGKADLLSPEYKQQIEQHAGYYNVPFYQGEGDILGVLKKAGQGFLEGFTASLYRSDEAPNSQTEAIAKNIGHLVGFAPGILSKPLRKLTKGRAGRSLAQLADVANEWSIPMLAANKATKFAAKNANASLKALGLKNIDNLGTVGKFIVGGASKNIAHQAFHLGVASSVGSWREGIDGMMESFVGGATAGAVFGGIGELATKGGFIDLRRAFKSTDTKIVTEAETALKALSGSLYQGLSAQAHGATTPEAIYEYLLGAYFGGGAVNWKRGAAMQFANNARKKGSEGTKAEREVYGKWFDKYGLDVEKHPDFYDQPLEVQRELRDSQVELFGVPGDNIKASAAAQLLRELKLKAEKGDIELTPEGFVDKGEYKDGESVLEVKESDIKRDIYMASTGSETDAALASIASEFGIPTINYITYRNAKDKVVGLDRRIRDTQLHEANAAIEKAAQGLTAPVIKGTHTEHVPRDITKLTPAQRMAIAKNYFAVKNAKSVYLITGLAANNTRIAGHNIEWAGQFAKDLYKDLYVYNINDGQWYYQSPQVGKLVRMTGKNPIPPKPPANMAMMGLHGVGENPAVHKAIKGWLGKHIPKRPIVDEIEKRIRKIAKNKKQKIEENIEAQKNLLKIIAKAEQLSDPTEDQILVKENAQEALKRNIEEIAQLESQAVADAIETATREDFKQVSEEVDSMIDSQGENAHKIGKTALTFVDQHLKSLWGKDAGYDTPFQQREAKINLTETVNDIFKKFAKKGSIKIKSTEAVEAINKVLADEYGATAEQLLGQNAQGEIRQWMTRFNLGRPVVHLQSDGTTFFRMKDDNNPVSKAGNRKLQEAPETILEKVAREAGASQKEPTLMTLDHVTVVDEKTGMNRDYDISRYREENPNGYDNLIRNIHKKANEKGYYIYGSYADKDKLMIAKYHPKLKTSEIDMKTLKKYYPEDEIFLSAVQAEKQGIDSAHHSDMLLSNVLYDLSFNGFALTKKNLSIMHAPGNQFIKGSAAFNKRGQIWFSPAYNADAKFIRDNYFEGDAPVWSSDGLFLFNSLLNENGKMNALIIPDGDKVLSEKEASLKTLENIKNPEHMDGPVIIEDSLLDVFNKAFGVPESGQNKSFIVSPHPELGALLGKFMFSGAGPTLSRTMRDSGIHMLIPDSSAKQKGARQFGSFEIKEGKDIEYIATGEIYEISPEDVRGSFSVYGNNHFFEPQRLPKQVMFNMLTTSYNPMEQEVINDMFEKIIGDRWNGESDYNDLVSNYLELGAKGEQVSSDISTIVNNVEKVGIPKLLEAMKSEHVPELSEAIYQKMLKVTKETLQQDLESGEIKVTEFKEYMEELSDFNSITDRVIKLATEISREAASNGYDITADSIYNHKFVRDFRLKAVQNFIVNSATKPKLKNSGVGFLKAYDKALQVDLDKANELLHRDNLDGINHNDEIFFLDNDHKATPIYLNTKKGKSVKSNLGRVWSEYKRELGSKVLNKERIAYLEEVLTAATVRVPMDSVSGLRVLKFKGFTGRKGHGMLMHSRAMRAQGTADTDGDKSFYFFGGNGGMDARMKQEFYKNQSEFDYKDADGKTHTKDGKEAPIKQDIGKFVKGTPIRDLLVVSGYKNADMQLAASSLSHYSPYERLRISAAAVDGRNQLGPAVSNSQLMKAAYSSIIAAGGEDTLLLTTRIEGKDGKPKWKKFKVTIKAKTAPEDLAYQLDMSRAQLNLASDPMDEIGLRGINVWKKLLWDAYFEPVDVVEYGKKKTSDYKDAVIEELALSEDVKYSYTNSGVFGHMVNLNKALWGRNWEKGRSYNMDEITNLTQSAIFIDNIPGASNSFLPKIGSLFSGIEWSDSPFARLNLDSVKYMYSEANKIAAKSNELKDLLGRSTLDTTDNAYIYNTMKMKLWDPVKRRQTSNSLSEFRKAIKGTRFEEILKHNKERDDKVKTSPAERLKILKEMNVQAEDFIVNDVSDIITINLLNEILSAGKIDPDRFRLISHKVDKLKKHSYLMAKVRRQLSESVEISSNEASNILIDVLREIEGKGKKDVRASKDDFKTAEMDQAEIDAEIIKFRKEKGLNNAENMLFDQLLLGSINRGKFLDKIREFERTNKDYNQLTLDFIKNLRDLNSSTAVSRLGFSSLAVNDKAVSLHLKRYMEMMNNNHRPLDKDQLRQLEEVLDSNVKVPSVVPDNIRKRATHSGYGSVDLESKVQNPKLASVVTEIAELLKKHPNLIGDGTGKTLNELTRGLDFLNKDIEAMDMHDFEMLRNWLHQVGSGTVWQRIKTLFGKQGKALSWRHYMELPRTVDRELMATDIDVLRQEGFFTDRKGLLHRGDIVRPTQFMDRLTNSVSVMMDAGTEIGDEYVTKFQTDQLFYQGLSEAPALWELAVRQREWEGRHEYKANAIKYGKPMSQVEETIRYLSKHYNDAKKNTNWGHLKNQEFYVNIDGKRVLMTGDKIVKRINKNLNVFFDNMHEVISGKEGALDIYRIGFYDPLTKESPKYDHESFLRDLDTYLNGKVPRNWKTFMKSTSESVPSIFGIDGVRAMMREMHIDFLSRIGKATKNKDYIKAAQRLGRFPIKKTGKLNTDTYFPRMFFEPSVVQKTLKQAQERIINDPNLSQESKVEELTKLQHKMKRLDGDFHFGDMEDVEVYDAVLQKLADKEAITSAQLDRWFNIDVSMGNMRTRENSSPGWSIAPTSVEAYARSLGNTYFRGLAGMLTRNIVSNPDTGIYQKLKAKWGHAQAEAWSNFAKLYTNDALGNPVTVSKKLIDNPDMALKYSPYAWWADDRVAERMNKISRKLGLGIVVEAGVHKVEKDVGVRKFISGMQDGADIEGLIFARENGYEVGGTVPKGYKSASGDKPEYSSLYRAIEIDDHSTKIYKGANKVWGPRTEANVKNADITIIFGDAMSAGSKLTVRHAQEHKKPYLINPTAADIKRVMKMNDYKVINIAGNRPEKLQKFYPDGIGKVLKEGFGARKTVSKDISTPERYLGPVDMFKLRKWSQMEAKYEMATLLAHPKSMMANIMGGTVHTVQSAGLNSLRKVYDYEYLQQINPELKSRKDVETFTVKHGVLPQWLIYEMGLQKEFQTNKGKEALKVISDAIKRNPDMDEGAIKQVLKDNLANVSEEITNTAAKFMTIPERRLRTDAFMAHYISAWNKFGGAIQDPHHPFLIELGKKGVSATQFLYSAPHRPAFARTALGKIFTRFQMYAWNSQALRGDVIRKIEVAGYDPNSRQGREAGRFIIGDIFMLALGQMFAYSLFESNLPQPWGWFQDTSDWVFGDEAERDRAFFGTWPTPIAPLQVITPTLARPVGPVIEAILSDDWSRIADYYAHTMIPFGRLGRDIYWKGGVLEAPVRTVDKLIGLPLIQFQREAKKIKEAKEDGSISSLKPRGIIGGYE